MRACVIAAAVIALTQPALAAKAHKKNSHRHHVSHLFSHHHGARHHRVYTRLRRVPIESGYGVQTFAPANTIDRRALGPSFQDQPGQQAWAAAPSQSGPFGEFTPRMRRARVHDGALDSMIERHAAANGCRLSSCVAW